MFDSKSQIRFFFVLIYITSIFNEILINILVQTIKRTTSTGTFSYISNETKIESSLSTLFSYLEQLFSLKKTMLSHCLIIIEYLHVWGYAIFAHLHVNLNFFQYWSILPLDLSFIPKKTTTKKPKKNNNNPPPTI